MKFQLIALSDWLKESSSFDTVYEIKKFLEKRREFLEEQKGQISIEMIIVLGAIVAVVFMVFNQLQTTAETATQTVQTKYSENLDSLLNRT